jgi:hypothetical protein
MGCMKDVVHLVGAKGVINGNLKEFRRGLKCDGEPVGCAEKECGDVRRLLLTNMTRRREKGRKKKRLHSASCKKVSFVVGTFRLLRNHKYGMFSHPSSPHPSPFRPRNEQIVVFCLWIHPMYNTLSIFFQPLPLPPGPPVQSLPSDHSTTFTISQPCSFTFTV